MTTHKGIDDLLAAGGTPKRLTGSEVEEFFQQLRSDHDGAIQDQSRSHVAIDPGRPTRAAFPMEVFPEAVRGFVNQVAKATGCPHDFPAVGALVIAGAAIGAARALCVKGGWVEQPGMYAAVVAPPGRMKTPALKTVMSPIYDEQDRLRQDYLNAVARFREESEAYKRTKPGAMDEIDELLGSPSSPPTKPAPMHNLFTSDTTVEALAVLLKENPKGLLVFRDEFTAWVGTMNQYRRGADRQFFLSAWSNEMIKVDRKSSQEGPLMVRHPFLSVLGSVQPDMLPILEAAGESEDGFIDRLLFAYPESQPFQGWTYAEISDESKHEWQVILGRLLALKPHRPEGASETPHLLHFTEGGQTAFAAFVNNLADEVNNRDVPPRIEGFCSKLRGYTARFALVVHLLRWATGEFENDWGEGRVSEEDVRRAVLLSDYFKSHAMAVYQCFKQSKEDKQVEAFISWLKRQGLTEVSPREIVRANVAGIKKSSDAKALMETTADRGYGEFLRTGAQARSVRFVLCQNPQLT